MVAVASYEGTVRERAVRSALVLTLLIGQELRIVYTSIVAFLVERKETESTFLRVCKGIVDQKKVVDAPHSLICQRTESCL